MRKFNILDQITGTKLEDVAACDIAERLGGAFVDPPAEVLEAIDELEGAVMRGWYSRDLEAYLGITLDPVA